MAIHLRKERSEGRRRIYYREIAGPTGRGMHRYKFCGRTEGERVTPPYVMVDQSLLGVRYDSRISHHNFGS